MARPGQSDEVAERREMVLAALAARPGERVSGGALAREIGCSRAAVHRHVDALRAVGVPIEATRAGYVLDPSADPVIPAAVMPLLTAPLAGPVRWSPETGSTNDDAAALARDGAPEGTVIGTDHQTAGRGRRGRAWVDAPGEALMYSIILRPRVSPVDAGLLPIVIAVGVADALEGCGVPDVEIAWPNDILAGGSKVVGILCEMSADQERVTWAVAGMGINVGPVPDVPDARWVPGSLAALCERPRRGELLVSALAAIGRRYEAWLEHGPVGIVSAFGRRDHLAGGPVTLGTAAGGVTGIARGIDSLGRLVVDGPDGEVAHGSGEVTGVDRGQA
jgi:BirA family transcriptional regulator, biotin operon repressor / biotin---[acetyl-CoA-carboxylase] ligase